MPSRAPMSLGLEEFALESDSSTYVKVSHSPSINLPDDFTVIIWIKTTSIPSTWSAVINKPFTGVPVNYRIYLNVDGYACGEIHDGTVGVIVNSHVNVCDGFWHCIALQRSVIEDKIRIYVDGELKNEETDTTTAAIESTEDLYISRGGEEFKGLYALTLIYNRALSEGEIKWNLINYHDPLRDGLVLWLPMEEGVGEWAYDKSGYNNHGHLGAGDPAKMPSWKRVMQWELRAEAEV